MGLLSQKKRLLPSRHYFFPGTDCQELPGYFSYVLHSWFPSSVLFQQEGWSITQHNQVVNKCFLASPNLWLEYIACNIQLVLIWGESFHLTEEILGNVWFLVVRNSFQTVLVLRKISSILELSQHKGYNKNREQWCEIKFSYMFLLTLLIYYYSNSEVEFTASKALVSIETTCPTCGKRVYFLTHHA